MTEAPAIANDVAPAATAGDARFARLRMLALVVWPLIAAATVVAIALMPPRSRDGTVATAAAFAFYAAFFAAAVRACRRAGLSLRDVIGSLPESNRPWLIAAGLAPLVLLFSAVTVMLTVTIASGFAPDWAARQASDQREADLIARLGATHKVLLALLITVLAPVAEEFVFRGMLLRRWMATRGLWTGLLGSAALFALLHPPLWIGAFVSGVVLGVLYLWSGSLLPAIFLHVLNNSIVLAAIAAGRGEGAGDQTVAAPGSTSVLVVGGILLVVVGWGIVRVVRPMIGELRKRRTVTAG